jgi:hypothetical protein
VLASGKSSYSIPLRMTAPGYVAGGTNFPVTSVRGIVAGDLVVAAASASGPPSSACELFQVTSNPASLPQVARVDNAWNKASTPASSYGDGAVLVNLGAPSDTTYSVSNNSMVMRTLTIGTDVDSTPSYGAAAGGAVPEHRPAAGPVRQGHERRRHGRHLGQRHAAVGDNPAGCRSSPCASRSSRAARSTKSRTPSTTPT